MNKQEAIEIGFKELEHFTVMDAIHYDIGRRRFLSFGCIGTPNEMLFICESDRKNPTKTNDLICLHNYDFDGYITEAKLKDYIKTLST